MKILAVESSCDETAVAVVEDGRTVLTDCIASQVALHRLYGGVVPELASRKHIEAIYALADEALSRASITRQEIDAIAVTYAPGLIGAVLVGVNFAKAAAYSLGVPLVPVHHIRGHIAANYLAYPDLEPPFLCLVVSGGHTLIVDVQDYTKFRIMGTTRDDAAGECFDKIARVIGMPYPGGAALDKAAQTGDETKYPMPHTKLSGNPLDMSFSGLKTAALNLIHTHEQRGEALDIPSLCASFSKAVSDMLVPRTMQALKETGYKTLAIAGGLAALGGSLLYQTGYEQWQCTHSSVPNMGFNGICAAFLGGLNPIGAIFSSFFIQHITSGGAYVDKSLYCSQISDLITAIIIYMCGFVLFLKTAMNNAAARREERQRLAAESAHAAAETEAASDPEREAASPQAPADSEKGGEAQ